MKCMNCETGKYKNKTKDIEVNIPGAPTVKVSGIAYSECDNCGDQILSAENIDSRDAKVLQALVKHYADDSHEMNGQVFDWIRKKIDLSLPEFIEKSRSRKDPSAYYQAKARSTNMDHWDKTALLLFARDFIDGTKKGLQHLKAIFADLQESRDEEVSSARIVEAARNR